MVNKKTEMVVTVTDRSFSERRPALPTVTISAFCPRCGRRRGRPDLIRWMEGDLLVKVHRWQNPCGHVDLYRDVLLEAERLRDDE